MADTKRAEKAFEAFTGHRVTKRRVSRLDDKNVAGWDLGPMVGVAYEARRDGVTRKYFHEFKPAARPRLVARDDGRQLYIDGGKYKVTDRGIEDMPFLYAVNPSPRAGSSKRKAKPMARRRRRAKTRRAPQIAVFRNPAPRRRRRRATSRRRTYARNPIFATRRRRSPSRRRAVRRSYRRNPSSRGLSLNFSKFLLPAAGIGAGAVGTELAMSYLPIPANFKTGVLRQVTKGVVGVAIGMVLGKVFKQKRLGNFFALGAVAIATHDALKEWITTGFPSAIGPRGMGYYLPPGRPSGALGYYNPAVVSSYGLSGSAMQRGDGTTPEFAINGV